MPTKTVSSSTANVSALEAQKNDSAKTSESREQVVIPVKPVASDMSNEENLLKEYSKELYVYTLDLLNSVRIDNAHKGVNGKAYMLKRTVSDIAVPLKTMAIASSDASKGAKVPA